MPYTIAIANTQPKIAKEYVFANAISSTENKIMAIVNTAIDA